MSYTLVIGTKRKSSWSLRPWLAMKVAGIPFTELLVPLDRPETRATLLQHTPTARVPILKDGPLTIGESTAIGEYLAERHPEARLWPVDPYRRAQARALSHEMHAGFAELRERCSFDIAHSHPTPAMTPGLRGEIARITQIWTEQRRVFSDAGPFLFGHFTFADAMFAPVASRFVTYGLSADTPEAAAYVTTLIKLPAMAEWKAAAEREGA